ncbi:hypothetical protein H4R33_006479, partial [Dimargaris cristalligena]
MKIALMTMVTLSVMAGVHALPSHGLVRRQVPAAPVQANPAPPQPTPPASAIPGPPAPATPAPPAPATLAPPAPVVPAPPATPAPAPVTPAPAPVVPAPTPIPAAPPAEVGKPIQGMASFEDEGPKHFGSCGSIETLETFTVAI